MRGIFRDKATACKWFLGGIIFALIVVCVVCIAVPFDRNDVTATQIDTQAASDSERLEAAYRGLQDELNAANGQIDDLQEELQERETESSTGGFAEWLAWYESLSEEEQNAYSEKLLQEQARSCEYDHPDNVDAEEFLRSLHDADE